MPAIHSSIARAASTMGKNSNLWRFAYKIFPFLSPSVEALKLGADASCFAIDGLSFSNHDVYDFSTLSALPDGLQAITETDKDPTSPYARKAVPYLVTVDNGYLTMEVPGGQDTSPILVGQVVTDVSDILYASVRTTAILSSVEGVCNGFFYYNNENAQEIDIEFLSSPDSQSNPGNGTTFMFYTDYSSNDASSTSTTSFMPSDAQSALHEYRVDWTDGSTEFYIDGYLVSTITENVANTGGAWMWNNWSDGGKGWTVGPPTDDAYLYISKIEMYYNTTTGDCA